MKAILGEKGQVTIPKALRDSLGLIPGQNLEFEEIEGKIILQSKATKDPLEKLIGLAENFEPQKSTDQILNEMRGKA